MYGGGGGGGGGAVEMILLYPAWLLPMCKFIGPQAVAGEVSSQ